MFQRGSLWRYSLEYLFRCRLCARHRRYCRFCFASNLILDRLTIPNADEVVPTPTVMAGLVLLFDAIRESALEDVGFDTGILAPLAEVRVGFFRVVLRACGPGSALGEKPPDHILLGAILGNGVPHPRWSLHSVALPRQAPAYRPGQDSRQLSQQRCPKVFVDRLRASGEFLRLVGEHHIKRDQAHTQPYRFIGTVDVWSVVCVDEEFMYGWKHKRPAEDMPSDEVVHAGEVFDYSFVQFATLRRLGSGDEPFSLHGCDHAKGIVVGFRFHQRVDIYRATILVILGPE